MRQGQPVKGRRAKRPKARKVSTAAPSIADLQKQVGALTRELKEAREEQTATTEVLQIINASPGDLAPVYDAILEKAHSLCAVAHGALLLYDGEKFRAVAVRGLSEALAELLRQGFIPGPNHPSQRLLEGARFAQVTDWAEIDDPVARGTLGAGIRTTFPDGWWSVSDRCTPGLLVLRAVCFLSGPKHNGAALGDYPWQTQKRSRV